METQVQFMREKLPSEHHIYSRHRFTNPGVRLGLPISMLLLIVLCGWLAAPRIRLIEGVALLFLGYVVISSLVAVCEITVVEGGMLVDRLLLPRRFVPWDAVDRVLIFAHIDLDTDHRFEVASIGLYEGLSWLNRLPGPIYGQGFLQTIVITPDALEDYDQLMAELRERCAVIRHRMG